MLGKAAHATSGDVPIRQAPPSAFPCLSGDHPSNHFEITRVAPQIVLQPLGGLPGNVWLPPNTARFSRTLLADNVKTGGFRNGARVNTACGGAETRTLFVSLDQAGGTGHVRHQDCRQSPLNALLTHVSPLCELANSMCGRGLSLWRPNVRVGCAPW